MKNNLINTFLSGLLVVSSNEEFQKSVFVDGSLKKALLVSGKIIFEKVAADKFSEFTSKISYKRLVKEIENPNNLNHFLSETIKPSIIKAFQYTKIWLFGEAKRIRRVKGIY